MLPAITVTQKYTLAIEPVNKKGNPAPLDGIPAWASSDESVATVVADESGLSATVLAQGVGSYTVSVSGDADLGAGVKTITASDSGEVTLGEATAISFKIGPVEEQ